MNGTLEITSVGSFIDFIKEFTFKIPPYKELLFRGQQSDKYSLLPSVGRTEKTPNLFAFERNLIEDVIANKPSEFIGLDYYNTLVKLQHYGLPTRLLDFTKNPLVALFFACELNEQTCHENGEILFKTHDKTNYYTEDNIIIQIMASFSQMTVYSHDSKFSDLVTGWFFSDENLAVRFRDFEKHWLTNKQGSQQKFIDDIVNCLLTPIFVHTKMTNERIIRQQGEFLLFPNEISYHPNNKTDECPLNDLIIKRSIKDYKQALLDDMHCNIIIPSKSKEKVFQELNLIGYNRMLLFPDLSECCSYIKNQILQYPNPI
jgi:hypothetical protein